MEKTLMVKDRLFGFRLAYGINLNLFDYEISEKFKDPERFDIVIFKYPDDESRLFIKRVIGLPGEVVEIKDGKVYIDGSPTIWSNRTNLFFHERESFESFRLSPSMK